MGDLGLCHVVTNSTFEQIREMAKGDAIRDLCRSNDITFACKDRQIPYRRPMNPPFPSATMWQQHRDDKYSIRIRDREGELLLSRRTLS